MQVEDINIECSNGIRLAAQSYTTATSSVLQQKNHRILCLHGWMDNCRSYHIIAPYLLQSFSTHIVALDFVGHGHSDHSAEPGVVLAQHVYYVAEALRVLGWVPGLGEAAGAEPATVTLIGHSMGAGVASLYAAAFPEHVERLVLLEGGTMM